VTASGIYFLTTEKDFDAIDLFRPENGAGTRVGRLPFRIPKAFPAMTFSRDGRWALTNQIGRRQSDLLMIEGFR
jgi:hypothetical protein